MAAEGVEQLVFSSSAAVYGTPDVPLVIETTATNPQSPYGESKLIGEWLLRDQARACGLRHTSLRYFNVVGSGVDWLYDSSPYNLFPLVVEALDDGRIPHINGDDYDTPDGTCVRDYVHVADLALSHVAAAKALQAGTPLDPVYNLGSGDGVSVRQIMAAFAVATGNDFDPAIARVSSPPVQLPHGISIGTCATLLPTWWKARWQPTAESFSTQFFPGSDFPQDRRDFAQNCGVGSVDGRVVVVVRQQPYLAIFALEGLNGCLAIKHGRDDLAIFGDRLLPDYDVVTATDRRIDHRVALHLEQEQRAVADQ